MHGPASWPGIIGRQDECAALTRLLAEVTAGRGQVLVLRGGAGTGKSALLDVLERRAAGSRCARVAAAPAESELAFAALHQLCAPYLGVLPDLPEKHAAALGTALRLRAGPCPEPPAVSAAVLHLLARIAAEAPVLCLVDDAQELDRASAEVLECVAGRLTTERVGLVFAVREPTAVPTLTGLPQLAVHGLDRTDAAALLDATVTFALDPRVRARILAESRGNPRALLELPRLPPAQLAFGGAGNEHRLPGRPAPPLPRQSRRLLLLAAAEPVGDVSLLLRAADRLGIPSQAVTSAQRSGLLDLDEVVRFPHPRQRTAIYRAAPPAERRVVHRALAEATDPDVDPGRRAWHRGRAAVGPDEDVAEELERCVDRAVASGGLASAAAFLEQAAALAPDPARRVRRALDAAATAVTAGRLDDASRLLAQVRQEPLAPRETARVELLVGRMLLAENGARQALPALLAAARRLEPLDPRLARDAHLEVMSAALLSGRPASSGSGIQVPDGSLSRPVEDDLLDALSVVSGHGLAAAAPALRRTVRRLAGHRWSVDETLRTGWPATIAAASTWDDESWDALTRRHLAVVRRTGALRALPLALHARASFYLFRGNLARAGALVGRGRALATSGSDVRVLGCTELGVLAFRGLADTAHPLLRHTLDEAGRRGEGYGVTMARWAEAVLDNGLGRYAPALDAAQAASRSPSGLGPAVWALAELVEAAVHVGDTAAAADGVERLSRTARASGTPWALGVEASRRALVEDGPAADALYREAVTLLGGTRVRVELARARLLYGEWLRREGRRVDARAQLRAAHQAFLRMGLAGFADRAGRELLATGETVRRRTADSSEQLTAQEAYIVRLVVDGRTNPEIAAALFISPRTVEWHLRRIFAKVGVRSRRELGRALAPPP